MGVPTFPHGDNLAFVEEDEFELVGQIYYAAEPKPRTEVADIANRASQGAAPPVEHYDTGFQLPAARSAAVFECWNISRHGIFYPYVRHFCLTPKRFSD
ncbi:MAG TPA: hypothetical protein VET25_12635 [Aestuariivirgaceae bacterium]|nr:hypothetical protein [Aestuariivirgaceae bacterium]